MLPPLQASNGGAPGRKREIAKLQIAVRTAMCYKLSLSPNHLQFLSPMVFSFFKKQKPPEKKMTSRPPAVPRPREDQRFGTVAPLVGEQPNGPSAELVGPDLTYPPPEVRESKTAEPSAFEFSETAPEFQIEADVDPVDAEAEEAAMLYANGQDSAARALLEHSTRTYRSGPGERLWLMLFDLYRLGGQKAPFEALEVAYAESFEKSPPIWRDAAVTSVSTRAMPTVLFKGDLSGDNSVGFDAVRVAVERNLHVRLDLSNVRRLDGAGCERLLELLHRARKSKREVELLGQDQVGILVDRRIVAGRATEKGCWLLKLEIYQLRGQLAAFEELAIDYAVTFEISPPSWEPERVANSGPAPLVLAPVDHLQAETYVLRGDLKAARFPDLLGYAKANDPVLIDCAAVTRMDFLSAGALLNVLTVVKRTGRQVVFRQPNYLLAELFRVVGLKNVADIVLPRN